MLRTLKDTLGCLALIEYLFALWLSPVGVCLASVMPVDERPERQIPLDPYTTESRTLKPP